MPIEDKLSNDWKKLRIFVQRKDSLFPKFFEEIRDDSSEYILPGKETKKDESYRENGKIYQGLLDLGIYV
jgi:hypothetical protein